MLEPLILYSTLVMISFETRELCDAFNKQRYYEEAECFIRYEYVSKPPLPRPKHKIFGGQHATAR